MKKIISTLIIVSFCLTSFSQRYFTNSFIELDSMIGGVYGTAIDYQSNNQSLLFDFYEPSNDNLTKRPLIIYIHGGGFTSGSRSYPSVKSLCRRMAIKGYTVANIDYRLDPNFELYNSTSDRRAMTDAMHDAKQAIRYFKANATTFGIDTSLVFIGGESAGAVTSMMASYIDKQSEMSAYPMANPNDPIGSGNNLDYSNNVAGTLCLCGLLLDTNAIESPSDPPLLWTHGDADFFIPISLSFNIVLRAVHIGLPIQTKVYKGATHCPWYYGNPDWAIYLDSTINDITTFLYPKVSSMVGISESTIDEGISVYPNPFINHLTIRLDKRYLDTKIKVVSSLGVNVFEAYHKSIDNKVDIIIPEAEAGLYYIIIENASMKAVKTAICLK